MSAASEHWRSATARSILVVVGRTRLVPVVFAAWCVFVAVYAATGHGVDPVSTAAVLCATGSYLVPARLAQGGSRSKVKLVVSAEERRAQRELEKVPHGLRGWYRLIDELCWLAEGAWPDGIAWAEGRPSKLRRTRGLRIITPLLGIAIVLAAAGTAGIGLPVWLPLLLSLVMAVVLGVYVTSRLVQEAKRRGWGNNLR